MVCAEEPVPMVEIEAEVGAIGFVMLGVMSRRID
jgi:hypothetical protein